MPDPVRHLKHKGNGQVMFAYSVNDDEETDRQMFPYTLRFLGWRDWIIVILYKILNVIADCSILYAIFDEDG